mmetsp:Transcript_8844/g.25464  ORF Transcript_8844/g.25464 Transcript_8844/m.25464 type:complete len:343 (+) Transcript_8844:472-1500(+)
MAGRLGDVIQLLPGVGVDRDSQVHDLRRHFVQLQRDGFVVSVRCTSHLVAGMTNRTIVGCFVRPKHLIDHDEVLVETEDAGIQIDIRAVGDIPCQSQAEIAEPCRLGGAGTRHLDAERFSSVILQLDDALLAHDRDSLTGVDDDVWQQIPGEAFEMGDGGTEVADARDADFDGTKHPVVRCGGIARQPSQEHGGGGAHIGWSELAEWHRSSGRIAAIDVDLSRFHMLQRHAGRRDAQDEVERQHVGRDAIKLQRNAFVVALRLAGELVAAVDDGGVLIADVSKIHSILHQNVSATVERHAGRIQIDGFVRIFKIPCEPDIQFGRLDGDGIPGLELDWVLGDD